MVSMIIRFAKVVSHDRLLLLRSKRFKFFVSLDFTSDPLDEGVQIRGL